MKNHVVVADINITLGIQVCDLSDVHDYGIRCTYMCQWIT